MKRGSAKRLVLGRETIRIMEDQQLAKVEGAGTGTCWCSNCNSSCDSVRRSLCECSMTGPTLC